MQPKACALTFPRHRQGDPDTTGQPRPGLLIRGPGDGQDRTPPDATSRHFPNPPLAFGGNSGDDASPGRGTATAGGAPLQGGLQNRNARFDSWVPRPDEHGKTPALTGAARRPAHAPDPSSHVIERHGSARFVHTTIHTAAVP